MITEMVFLHCKPNKKSIIDKMENDEILSQILEFQQQIKSVNEWNNFERAKMSQKLAELQEEFNSEISIGEEYEILIKQKLDKISKLKMEVYGRIPDNNGFDDMCN